MGYCSNFSGLKSLAMADFQWSLEALTSPQRLSFEDKQVVSKYVAGKVEDEVMKSFSEALELMETREETEELLKIVTESVTAIAIAEEAKSICTKRPPKPIPSRSRKKTTNNNTDTKTITGLNPITDLDCDELKG